MGKICPKFWAKPLPKNPKSSLTVDIGFPRDQPGPLAFSLAPLSTRSLGKSLWVTSQFTEKSRFDWAENAWGPGITRGATSCQRWQNVEKLLTIQYHLSLRFHFRFRYLLLALLLLLLLRWTGKAWLESLPAVLGSTWKISGKKASNDESVEYDRPAISTQLCNEL